jgi:uncharacterized phage protein (TIGR02220 family)
MDILCALWNAKKRGRRTLSLEGWAGEIGKPSADVSLYLYELEQKEIGKIFRKNDDEITITSPRMIRDERARKWNAKRKQEQRDKHLSQECPANVSILSQQCHRDISESESESELREIKKEKSIVGLVPNVTGEAEVLLTFLNERTGKHFQARKPNGEPTATLKFLQTLLKHQYTPTQIRQVIANRWLRWGTDPKMQEYLRPSTLFRPSNFEQYLGELGVANDL